MIEAEKNEVRARLRTHSSLYEPLEVYESPSHSFDLDEISVNASDDDEDSILDPVAEKLKFLNMLNCCGLEDNIFVLVCLFIGTTIFTVSQFIGAIAANSLSMFGDSSTMLLDSLTYLLNIYCEKRKISGSKYAAKLEIFVASISVAALTFVTIYLLWDSISRLRSGHLETDDVDVDIMLKFSLGNFIIDIFSCSVFLSKLKETRVTRRSPRRRKNQPYEPIASNSSKFFDEKMPPESEARNRKNSEEDQRNRVTIELNKDIDIEIVDKTGKKKSYEARNLNMASAFLHLGADTLRTLTVMITALIVDIDEKDVDSVDADAIGSIVVCVIILAVVVALCFELVGLTMSLTDWDLESDVEEGVHSRSRKATEIP